MKTVLRRAFNYWIPPLATKADCCPICEGLFGWSINAPIEHAPECPTQADPVAVAKFATLLLYLQTLLVPSPRPLFEIVVPDRFLQRLHEVEEA